MEKKLNWDDIPSLDGLCMDFEYKPKTSLDKRAFFRLSDEDVARLFQIKEILVRISTVSKIYTAQLLDISEGGLSLKLHDSLEENLPLKVGFFLGTKKILSKAIVRHSCKAKDWYRTGIQFIDLDKESSEYISELYASKILYLAR